MTKLSLETNADKIKMSKNQAHYFAIQVFSNMKKYIQDHRQEYEQWCAINGITEDEKKEVKAHE